MQSIEYQYFIKNKTFCDIVFQNGKNRKYVKYF